MIEPECDSSVMLVPSSLSTIVFRVSLDFLGLVEVIGSDLDYDPERSEQSNVTSVTGFGVLEVNAGVDAGSLVEFDSLGSRGRLTTKGGV